MGYTGTTEVRIGLLLERGCVRVGVGCVAAEPGDYGSVLFVVFECAERRDEREWNRGGETRREMPVCCMSAPDGCVK